MESCGEIPREGAIVKETLRVAWPSMLESFANNLAGLIDMILVGSLGTTAIAAVGLTTQPTFIALAPCFALNAAVSAVIARRKGENNGRSANLILRMALIMTLVFTLVVSMLCVIFARPLMLMVGAQPDTIEMAADYYRVNMMGIIFMTLQMSVNSAQKGVGNTRVPMVTNIVSNVVDMVVSYGLIGGHFGLPAMGVRGAAVGTVIGTGVGCFLSLSFVIFRRTDFLCLSSAKGWIADRQSRKALVKVGSSALVEQICIRVGFLLFVMTVANLGTPEMAAHQIGMNMMSISFAFGDGLAIASMTLIGQSLGRKRPDMAKLYGVSCQRVGLCFALLISLVYMTFGRGIFALFDRDRSEIVLNYGAVIMRILSIILILQIEQVVQFGCLRGAGDTKYTAAISLISVTLIRPGMSFLLCYPLGLGLVGAWLGTACDQLVRFVLSYRRFHKGEWTKLKL